MKTLPFAPLVAVVEDDPGLCTDLVEFLLLRGFAARGFVSAEAFYQAWPAVHFDLLLLDVALPGASGLDIARRVRAVDTAGVVMLTALDADDDQVAGLGAGADIYLSKHSSLEVIEAACHSVLRRLASGGAAPVETARADVWRLDALHWRLDAPDGTPVDLTHAEALLLSVLFRNPGEAIAREQLLILLGKPNTLSNLRNLDNAASRLRRKVQQACGVELPVRPSYGKGYTFGGACEVRT
jgi:DNA-binding response OmpR family regulator